MFKTTFWRGVAAHLLAAVITIVIVWVPMWMFVAALFSISRGSLF
jgi:hypothetical protein